MAVDVVPKDDAAKIGQLLSRSGGRESARRVALDKFLRVSRGNHFVTIARFSVVARHRMRFHLCKDRRL